MATEDPNILTTTISVDEIHANTSQTIIQVTEDRLRLRLVEHLKSVETKHRWLIPFGIFISLLLAILTTDFKDVWDIEKAAWKGGFYLATFASLVWTGWWLLSGWKSVTIDELIKNIKSSQ